MAEEGMCAGKVTHLAMNDAGEPTPSLGQCITITLKPVIMKSVALPIEATLGRKLICVVSAYAALWLSVAISGKS